jgi:hypothetical protein
MCWTGRTTAVTRAAHPGLLIDDAWGLARSSATIAVENPAPVSR